MEQIAAWIAERGADLGIDASIAKAGAGVLLAALLVWLGHWVSRANATLAADVQTAEKAAVLDLRELRLSGSSESQRLAFEVRNLGALPATDVHVVLHVPGGADGSHAAWCAVVAPDDRPILDIGLFGADIREFEVKLSWRDHRGRIISNCRRLEFDGAGGPPRQAGTG